MQASNKPLSSARLVLGAPASSRRVEGAKENHVHPSNHAQSPLSLSGSLSSPEAFLAAVAPFFKNSRQRHYVSVHLLRLHGSRPFVLRAKEAGQARVDADDAHSILRLVLRLVLLALSLSLANCETLKMREESQVM